MKWFVAKTRFLMFEIKEELALLAVLTKSDRASFWVKDSDLDTEAVLGKISWLLLLFGSSYLQEINKCYHMNCWEFDSIYLRSSIELMLELELSSTLIKEVLDLSFSELALAAK